MIGESGISKYSKNFGIYKNYYLTKTDYQTTFRNFPKSQNLFMMNNLQICSRKMDINTIRKSDFAFTQKSALTPYISIFISVSNNITKYSLFWFYLKCGLSKRKRIWFMDLCRTKL